MPITQFLDGHSFDPETRRVMGVALEMARAALRLAERTDAITEIPPRESLRSRRKA